MSNETLLAVFRSEAYSFSSTSQNRNSGGVGSKDEVLVGIASSPVEAASIISKDAEQMIWEPENRSLLFKWDDLYEGIEISYSKSIKWKAKPITVGQHLATH